MRLLEFSLQNYRNLHDLPILFTVDYDKRPDNTCSIRFLVGVNGTGKSNLLRFLAAIFSALDEGYQYPRPANPAYNASFRLVYQLRGNTVTVQSTGQGRTGITFIVNDRIYDAGDFPGRDLILPAALMIYTSGDIQIWNALLKTPLSSKSSSEENLQEPFPLSILYEAELPPNDAEIEFEEDYIDPDATNEQTDDQQTNDEFLRTGQERVFLVEPKHLPLALLAAFIRYHASMEHRIDALEPDFGQILEQVGISRLIGFSMHIAYDPRKFTTSLQRGTLARLYKEATLPLKEWNNEQLWTFDIEDVKDGQPLFARLAKGRSDEQEQQGGQVQSFQFFRALVDLQKAGILKQVNLVIAKHHYLDQEKNNHILLAESLSDGEQAFLERMALIYLLSDDECLFLLDEPENHFNDAWKRDLVNQIELTLKETNSEVILTTHASITLSDAYPDEVILLTHNGQENVPLTLAAEPGELLRSVFGAEESVGRRAIRMIEGSISEEKPEEKREKLRSLLRSVGPGYFRFKIIEELRSVSSNQDS